ncbi:RNA polymerase-binding protein RbpA [Kocuria sp. APC 4018]|uniref:RNA polymerase-binding protein RbpA n=1 Tax=Kocuria sp. APC 4018 TaxID=3035196 RepID=UPI0025B328BC|nr:RNA polymerase-binding protein RbpA [Kocuria sp. APC 4018]MDN3461644.1 RNA polymerase-binding protein RbpA [Kocuria sp. APC 4018]
MSDRSLRGMRLGSQSMETEAGVEPAPRQRMEYRTADGESVSVMFAAEAEIPPVWTTKTGQEAILVNGEKPENPNEKHQRSHWDMLLERRSVEELEETLQQRLEFYKEQHAL